MRFDPTPPSAAAHGVPRNRRCFQVVLTHEILFLLTVTEKVTFFMNDFSELICV